jgi:hypothetical protein
VSLIRLPTRPQRWNVSPLQYGQCKGLSSFSRFTLGSCNTICIEGSLWMSSLITTFYREPSFLSKPTSFVTVTMYCHRNKLGGQYYEMAKDAPCQGHFVVLCPEWAGNQAAHELSW